MFTSVSVESYRGFHNYRIDKLARVNLLVGKNSSGKTSLLEAVQLLASGGSPEVFSSTAWRRGEVLLPDKDEDEPPFGSTGVADVSHFFCGHEFGAGSQFKLGSNSEFGEMSVRVVAPSEVRESRHPDDFTMFDRVHAPLAMVVKRKSGKVTQKDTALPVWANGAFPLTDYLRFSLAGRTRVRRMENIQFISPDSLTASPMSAMWNKVIVEGKEAEVIAAMQIIEPKLSNLFFLAGGAASRSTGCAGIVAGLEGSKQRVPLGSYGEGMRRLLALSLSLIQAKGGILLVDEIDTGLHYSVMGAMWLLVVKAAVYSDVQVFATTHSLDCVRGLAWLCENYSDLSPNTSVQKVDREIETSVALEARDIVTAVAQDIEVR